MNVSYAIVVWKIISTYFFECAFAMKCLSIVVDWLGIIQKQSWFPEFCYICPRARNLNFNAEL